MKKFAHAHSAAIKNRQFRARIARKECSHFSEVGRKVRSLSREIQTEYFQSLVSCSERKFQNIKTKN